MIDCRFASDRSRQAGYAAFAAATAASMSAWSANATCFVTTPSAGS